MTPLLRFICHLFKSQYSWEFIHLTDGCIFCGFVYKTTNFVCKSNFVRVFCLHFLFQSRRQFKSFIEICLMVYSLLEIGGDCKVE